MVLLEDWEGDVIRDMLCYIYSCSLSLCSLERTLMLLKAAHRFGVPLLRNELMSTLEECISVETSEPILRLACVDDHIPELKELWFSALQVHTCTDVEQLLELGTRLDTHESKMAEKIYHLAFERASTNACPKNCMALLVRLICCLVRVLSALTFLPLVSRALASSDRRIAAHRGSSTAACLWHVKTPKLP